MTTAINASAAGDTVICTGGAQPKLTLSKSFPAPGITIRCDSGSYFEGIDTNGQSGYTFDGITSRVPVEAENYDITPFYLAGTSERIKLTGAFKLSGGYDGIKVYGGCKDCTIDDGGAASEISGYGGDGIHINQAVNLRIESVSIGSPWQDGPTPEHNDGIHAQAFTNLYIGPGVRIEARDRAPTPIRPASSSKKAAAAQATSCSRGRRSDGRSAAVCSSCGSTVHASSATSRSPTQA